MSLKRKYWEFDEEKYTSNEGFYDRIKKWYNGAMDLCPNLFKDFNFPDYKQFFSLGGVSEQFETYRREVYSIEKDDSKYLIDGKLPTINMGKQPVIGVIYGPTGSGKSHLIRAIISCNMLHPIPETVFFITPEKNMIPPIEQTSWNLQLVESNYDCNEDGTITPKTSTFKPSFVELSYDEATDIKNLNIDSPDNIYVQASKKGPIAIVMDECMDRLCSGSSVSVLFHALPSKLFARNAACTAFYIFVVLHNMAPRTAIGNVPTLKVNAKMHIVSCHIPQFQFSRFLFSFAHNISKEIMVLLKSYFTFLQQSQKFSWIMYTPDPVSESFRWTTIDTNYNIIPLNINIQEKFLKSSNVVMRFCEKNKKRMIHNKSMIKVESVHPIGEITKEAEN